ncbi:hypothetical protein K2173_007502 [Erythroxylum novogranatense]|uniref:Dehydrin n=1 Tax=Erythroxylum novogranatense TaxID=1862640 RepID=A0AAV8T8E4_9ROSI|nr:hypothetical protein K2173_007502 [Erythroxylum novogranatense]
MDSAWSVMCPPCPDWFGTVSLLLLDRVRSALSHTIKAHTLSQRTISKKAYQLPHLRALLIDSPLFIQVLVVEVKIFRMADDKVYKSHECESTPVVDESTAEIKDRGVFDFLGKKEEEKHQEEVMAAQFEEKVRVSEHETKEKEEKKPGLLEKLHRSSSSSSSSSDEEEGEGEEKKKKKKGLKEKIKEKISGDKEHEEEKKHEDTAVPVEKCDVEVSHTETHHHQPVEVIHSEQPSQETEEKKGFLEKIKEKLPGHHKKPEEVVTPPPTETCTPPETTHSPDAEAKEKKGILEKIKEKLPGYHPKTEEEKEKEKEKESGCH